MSQDFDQLFRDKLQNHEAQPSAEAWAKLQGKLPKKDRKPFWFLGLGVLLCGIGVAYWYFGNSLTETQNLEQKANAFDQKIEKVEENAKPEATQNTENSSVLERKNLEAKQKETAVFVPNLKKNAVLKLEETPEIKMVLEEKTETKSETKLENQTEKVVEKPMEVEPKAEPEMPITVVIKRGDQAASRQEPFNEEDSLLKKKPRFLRILKQLHNFKEGEKVNFQDLKRDKE